MNNNKNKMNNKKNIKNKKYSKNMIKNKCKVCFHIKYKIGQFRIFMNVIFVKKN